MLIKCPECGHQVSDQAKTCPSCGIDIAGKITRCPDCGEVIFKEQGECPNCHCSINGANHGSMAPHEPTVPVVRQKPQQPEEPEKAPRRPRKRRAGVTAFIVAFVLALIVVLLGLYFMKTQEKEQEQAAYENAMNSTEPMVLQSFLAVYKDAPLAHRDSIKVHLQSLMKVENDWNDALVNNSKFAFERFLKLHPESLHKVEATIKIDSIDWETAKNENTAEAYKKYFTDHEDGAYYDEATANYERLEAQKVTAEDQLVVKQLFTTYFNALSHKDETALATTLAPVLTSFLHRANATKEDVRQYMDKLYEANVLRMEFTPNGDWNIEKNNLGEGHFSYTVNFTVAQRTERGGEDGQFDVESVVFKVTAQVSPEGRISELNMKRSVQ